MEQPRPACRSAFALATRLFMPHSRCSHSSTVRCEWSHPPFSDSGFIHHARWACRYARPRGNQRRRVAFPILFDDCSQRADASPVRGEPVEPRALGAAGNPARAERRSRVQARRGHRQCGATGRPRSAAVEQGARPGLLNPFFQTRAKDAVPGLAVRPAHRERWINNIGGYTPMLRACLSSSGIHSGAIRHSR